MPPVTLRYERAKLYEEIWEEAVTTVAKRYGVSDVALRKICKQLAVPLPPLGYWARVAAGRKPPTPSLPKYSGAAEIVRQRYVSDEPVEPDPEHLVARREFEARPENRIVVSETLDTPHPLVVATERAFRRPKHRDLRNLPTTIDIDDPILKNLRRLQRREGKSLGRLVSDLLARPWLRRVRPNRRPHLPSNGTARRHEGKSRPRCTTGTEVFCVASVTAMS